VAAHREAVELIRDALEEGRDYGSIPGTDRPALLKPGAERLAIAFGASGLYEIVEREIDHDRRVRWVKRRKDWRGPKDKGGRPLNTIEESGESLGLYRYVVRCKLVRPDGRVLGEGLGACSTMEAKYIDRPRDCENTALKMAEKRALVAAALGAFGLSDRFTQDVEDAPPKEAKGKEAKGKAPTAAEGPAAEPRATAEQGDRFRSAIARAGMNRDTAIALLKEATGREKMSEATRAALEKAIALAEEKAAAHAAAIDVEPEEAPPAPEEETQETQEDRI
jgi:hypothetical protein